MRVFVVVCVLLGLALAAPALAQQPADPRGETESLRRDLEQMRQQFERVRQEYEKAMGVMAERLQRIAAQPRAAAAPPAVVQAPAGPAPSPQPSLRDYVTPRPPFSLAERTQGGRLLFDIGVVADFIGNITQRNIDKADAGSFAGRENRFFPREVELQLFGQIDPFARGEVRLEAAEEFEDGERVTEVGLAEAHLTLLTLPFGTQLKAGQMRNRFGLLNERHREALPQPDVPNVLTRFLGEEGLVERGVELTWVPPLPFYLEALVGVFNGDNEEAFGRGSLKTPLATGRLRTFFELGDLGAIQLGASAASGQTEARRRQTFAGYDVKYKLTPEGWRHPLLTLASEGIWSFRRVQEDEEIDSRRRFGWYAYGEVQPWRRWVAGLRYDSTQLLEDPGREWAIEPYLAFMLSDFLRFRLGYKRTERDRRELFSANDASARIADEIFLQATFFLGAHPPHPF
ncbi:MAG TPA: hypothetical protein VGV13_05320 [Methylomirabilota bacterium]|nr:hypothetical protein [Methylomirabilota bacterium]